MTTIRLTAAQALVRYLENQFNEEGERFIAGVWAIFGHGNVAGLGEALHAARERLPTWRGHNEQTMAHIASAYARQTRRRRAMAVTTSIGPGATNLVTAAALAHVNRLPLLLLPGDVFASRGPDPVLQQIEDFSDATVSANDTLRPVSRFFDRITRPEQLLEALPRAFATLTDPAACGPVTLALCQDVQAEAFDWPEEFFAPRRWIIRRPAPDRAELAEAVALLEAAERPLIVAGGGVHYAEACETLRAFAERRGIPVAETQAGKSALPWDHPLNLGGLGVTGTAAANALAAEADLVFGIGTRFQDFTTGSRALFRNPRRRILAVNVQPFDAVKHGAHMLVADAKVGLEALDAALGDRRWSPPDPDLRARWFAAADAVTAAPDGPANALPTDAQVVGAVQRTAGPDTVVVCAAGTMPGELHKLWKAGRPGSYHVEYGYSCMGYEIPAAIGIRMAEPEREVVCFVGDGTYMMANSELATAVMMGIDFTVILTDNRGFGCINRLQKACGGAPFNNLLDDAIHARPAAIDYAAHAAAMGAKAVRVRTIADLEAALAARTGEGVEVIVVETDPEPATGIGGHWWEVAVPEVSERAEVRAARADYERHLAERGRR